MSSGFICIETPLQKLQTLLSMQFNLILNNIICWKEGFEKCGRKVVMKIFVFCDSFLKNHA